MAVPGTLDLREYIRDIPNYPRRGIVFRDVTPLFLDPEALEHAISLLALWADEREVDYIVAAEARGFVLGGALSERARAALRDLGARRGSDPAGALVAARRAGGRGDAESVDEGHALAAGADDPRGLHPDGGRAPAASGVAPGGRRLPVRTGLRGDH